MSILREAKVKYILLLLLFAGGNAFSLTAQEAGVTSSDGQEQSQGEQKKSRKAWEFGLGGSALQFNRTSFSNFTNTGSGYLFDLDVRHVVWGGNIYIARELGTHFFLDLQGTAGYTKESISANGDRKWFFMGGPGLQWRLGEYFNSKYIDPYLRVGVSYMRKNFDILYTGSEGLTGEEMTWIMENFRNKDGADKKNLFPISLGGGVNMWLNDRWGIGLQVDYLLMPHSNVANSLQGTARVMFRLGGKSKKTLPSVQYVETERIVERIVEKTVEKPVEVEKIVEVRTLETLNEIFRNIDFDFDKYTLTGESMTNLNEAANIMKGDTSRKFLITGFTDSKGSPQYNLVLSKKRAKAVVDALLERGVPASMLKSRGAGSKISLAAANASDIVRRGDRKVTIEQITNMEYWDHLSKDDL